MTDAGAVTAAGSASADLALTMTAVLTNPDQFTFHAGASNIPESAAGRYRHNPLRVKDTLKRDRFDLNQCACMRRWLLVETTTEACSGRLADLTQYRRRRVEPPAQARRRGTHNCIAREATHT